jgi:hypothetical protein
MTIASMSPLFFLAQSAWHARRTVASVLCLLLPMLAGCDPALNWREVRSSDAGYTVLLPAKPVSFERSVDLDGLQVTMSMTAADVDNTSFAVATAVVTDEAQRTSALMAMQTAMTRNIQGEITEQKTITMKNGATAVQIRATGKAARDGKPMVLFGRFLMHGTRVFQVIALGPTEKLDAETADTFLNSFTLH